MRIVIDLQPCQSGSRLRGIGRNALSMACAMIPLLARQQHEVIVALNSAFPDEGRMVRDVIRKIGPDVAFFEFSVPTPCAAANPENAWRQRAAEFLREVAVAALSPDFVHLSQLAADGWADDTIASIRSSGLHIPTALTQHDLIPLVMEDIYMPPGAFRDFYLRKIDGVRNADLLLAISEFSRQEVIDRLGVEGKDVITVSSGVAEEFRHRNSDKSDVSTILSKFGLDPGFLFYAPGGFDPRKNIDRLFRAYGMLPQELRRTRPLVLASKLYEGQRETLKAMATDCGIGSDEMYLTDYVSDEELGALYQGCFLYIFPSLHEGFGLPVLEAMSCGAVVIAADGSGIPEAMGMQEALFDPRSAESIHGKMLQAMTDKGFRERLTEHCVHHHRHYSWSASARIALSAIESKHAELVAVGWRPTTPDALPSSDALLEAIALTCGVSPSADDLRLFRQCHNHNLAAAGLCLARLTAASE